MTEIAEAALEAADQVTETLFPPRPGGLVDRHRRREAARNAEIEESEHVAEKIEQPSYKAVKIASQSPEVFSAITYTIQAGGSAPVLPQGPYRYRAVVMVVTSGSSVILARDNGNAISGSGFLLPYGIPMPVHTRAQVYAFNNTGATVQVSVFAEIYAPEGS
jgi:hypothetical protein